MSLLLLSRFSHVGGTMGRVPHCEEREVWQARRQEVLAWLKRRHGSEKEDYSHLNQSFIGNRKLNTKS